MPHDAMHESGTLGCSEKLGRESGVLGVGSGRDGMGWGHGTVRYGIHGARLQYAPFRSRCRDCWKGKGKGKGKAMNTECHWVHRVRRDMLERNAHVIESKKVVCAKRTDDAHRKAW